MLVLGLILNTEGNSIAACNKDVSSQGGFGDLLRKDMPKACRIVKYT